MLGVIVLAALDQVNDSRYSGLTETNNAYTKMNNNSHWLNIAQAYISSKNGDAIYARLADVEPTREWNAVMHSVNARLLSEIALPIAGDAEQSVRNVIELHQAASSDDKAAWLYARESVRDYLLSAKRTYPLTSEGAASAKADHAKIVAATSAELSTLCVHIDNDREYGHDCESSTMLVIEQLIAEMTRIGDRELDVAWVAIMNIITEEMSA